MSRTQWASCCNVATLATQRSPDPGLKPNSPPPVCCLQWGTSALRQNFYVTPAGTLQKKCSQVASVEWREHTWFSYVLSSRHDKIWPRLPVKLFPGRGFFKFQWTQYFFEVTWVFFTSKSRSNFYYRHLRLLLLTGGFHVTSLRVRFMSNRFNVVYYSLQVTAEFLAEILSRYVWYWLSRFASSSDTFLYHVIVPTLHAPWCCFTCSFPPVRTLRLFWYRIYPYIGISARPLCPTCRLRARYILLAC
jgi:hypothetical protein